MFIKQVLIIASALYIQSIWCQCIGVYDGILGPSYPGAPCSAYPYSIAGAEFAYSPAVLAASKGGGFAVTSVTPIIPNGISVVSENAYDGSVSVSGQIPFLSVVTLEGALPSIGAGAITYGCGNGNVAILSEDIIPPYDPLPYGPYGYGPAGVGYGCGYGPIY